ncbi:MAG TPA: hypothetical protein PKA28_14250 [Methylomusa anaerophila]|uniref:hypothetical protein n=1 Tax=Methylomusa anaerophila TaxID=1930071 RepID=UPI00139698AC|nr:hypothetical protein [Methylomusa anaerophila]HML89601.1 hypothetical protein [Methylomusa anaerophila]
MKNGIAALAFALTLEERLYFPVIAESEVISLKAKGTKRADGRDSLCHCPAYS